MAYSFTNGQKRFIKSLAAQTGLNQRVIAAWVFSEMNGGAARGYEKRGYYNWLNIGHTDSGNLSLTGDRTWRSPESAAKATADFLRGKRYGPGPGIKKIIGYAGKSPQAQMNAIANSGWATSSYEKGSTLRSIYSGLGNSFAGQPSKSGKLDKSGGISAPKSSSVPSADATTAILNYTKMRRQGRASVADLATALASSSTPAVETAQGAEPKSKTPSMPSSGGGKGSQIKELFYDPQGGWKGKTNIGPIGGHGGHVHVAAGKQTVIRLGKVAQKMGLRVAENKAFDKVDPVHTTNSWHYRDRAIDVSGDPKKMAAFARYVRRKYGLK